MAMLIACTGYCVSRAVCALYVCYVYCIVGLWEYFWDRGRLVSFENYMDIRCSMVLVSVHIAFLQFYFGSLFSVHIRTVIWWVSVFVKTWIFNNNNNNNKKSIWIQKYQWTMNKSIKSVLIWANFWMGNMKPLLNQVSNNGIMNLYFFSFFSDEFWQ